MNQGDVDERNHQVSLMSRIYTNADTVFAYIGPEPPEDILDAQAFASKTWYHHLDRSKIKVVLTLVNIAHREYWTRLWIVQELRCACQAVIWCGRYPVERKVLHSNLKNLLHKRKAGRMVYESISMEGMSMWKHIEELDYDHGKRLCRLLAPPENAAATNLWAVLDTYSGNACEDPRDRIYGLQSLVPAKERIAIDYSITFENLMYKIVKDRVAPVVYTRIIHPKPPKTDVWDANLVNIFTKLIDTQSTFSVDINAMSWAFMICHRLIVGKSFRWCGKFAVTAKQRDLAQSLEAMSVALESENGFSADMERRVFERIVTRHGFVLFGNFIYHPDEWPFSAGIAAQRPIHALLEEYGRGFCKRPRQQTIRDKYLHQ